MKEIDILIIVIIALGIALALARQTIIRQKKKLKISEKTISLYSQLLDYPDKADTQVIANNLLFFEENRISVDWKTNALAGFLCTKRFSTLPDPKLLNDVLSITMKNMFVVDQISNSVIDQIKNYIFSGDEEEIRKKIYEVADYLIDASKRELDHTIYVVRFIFKNSRSDKKYTDLLAEALSEKNFYFLVD